MKDRMHQQVEVSDHLGKGLRCSKSGMGCTFIDSEHTSKGIFHRSRDPFQLVGLHLANVDDAIGRQNFIAKDEMIRSSPCKSHLRPMFEISHGDTQIISSLFDAAFFCDFFHFDHRISRRVSIF